MTVERRTGQAVVKVEVLPARAAYLICEDSRDGFRRAVQEASTRWGGMAEPIIPVSATGVVEGWWQQVVESAAVEGFVNVDVSADVAQHLSDSFGLPVTELADIDRSGPTRFTVHPASVRDPLLGSMAQLPVAACPDAPLWQATLAGDFTAEHEAEHAGMGVFRRPTSSDQVGRAALWGHSALDRAIACFRENYAEGSWPVPAVIWVVSEDDFLDCLHFWNLRALRSLLDPNPMVLVPASEVEHWIGFGTELAGQLSRHAEFAPDVVVVSHSVPAETLHELATRVLGLELTEEKLSTGFKVPAELRSPPFKYRVNLDLRHMVVFERRYGEVRRTEVYATDGCAQLRVGSPVDFTGGGKVLLRLNSPLFDALPARDVLAGKIANAAVWRGRSLQIATHALDSYQVDLSVPSLSEAVNALLLEKTAAWVLSEKGRLAATLLEDTDLSVLLRPSVYEAVVHLTTPRATAYRREMEQMRASGLSSDEIDEFCARWGGRGERRYDSANGFIARVGKSALEPVAAMETLCAIGWAERGFETDCGRCGIRSFVPLAVAESAARCPGCRGVTAYTRSLDSVVLHYRLNTLIDRASDQGVIPHLLAIAALIERDPLTNLLGGTLATFPGDVVREIDIAGIHGQQYIAGEVKSKAVDFTPDQLTRDFDTSARLGVDTHLLAAVDDIPTQIEESARARAEAAGLQIVILSRAELRPVPVCEPDS